MARQAYALDVLLAEINAHAPNRSKASDGGLGDQAHASRVSDHNPNAAGVWRARDVTDDPAGGLGGSDLFHRVLNLMREGHPALKSGAYLIHNALIVSYDRLSEGLRDYDGENAHTKHVHISVSTAASGYDSRRAWNLWANAEKPVAPEPAPRVPTVADLVVTLKRLKANTTNENAQKAYTHAISLLGDIAGSSRVTTPSTLDGVRKALRGKLLTDLTAEQRRNISAAYDVIRGI